MREFEESRDDRRLEGVDDFNEIRARHEQAAMESKLKRRLFWGYSPKSVHQLINQYKDTLNMMQTSFESQLTDIRSELERLFNERSIIKQQLTEELERSKGLQRFKQEADDYREQVEGLQKRQQELEAEKTQALEAMQQAQKAMLEAQEAVRQAQQQSQSAADQLGSDGKKALEKAQNDYQELNKRYQALQAEVTRLQTQSVQAERDRASFQNRLETGTAQQPAGEESPAVLKLRQELDALTDYAQSLEKQRDSLNAQLSSLRVINRELESLSGEYEVNKDEMERYRAVSLSLRRDNERLLTEMESTGAVLAEILEQVDQKERERDTLKRRLELQNDQLLSVMREKQDLQDSQLQLTNRIHELEGQLRENKDLYEQAQAQMELLQERCAELESSRVVQLFPARNDSPSAQTTSIKPPVPSRERTSVTTPGTTGTEDLHEKVKGVLDRSSQLRKDISQRQNDLNPDTKQGGSDSMSG